MSIVDAQNGGHLRISFLPKRLERRRETERPMAAVGEDENEEEDVVEGRQAGRRTATSSVQSACEGPTHFKLRNVALLFALSGTADATRSLQSTSVTPDIEQAPGDPRCCTNATYTMFSQSYVTRPRPL